MTPMERDFNVLGRLLSDLIGNGLTRVNYQGKDAMRICEIVDEHDKQIVASLRNVLDWMRDEGYIRVEEANRFHNTFYYTGVQLTSKGIAAIHASPAGAGLEGTIRQAIEGSRLDTAGYTRIGSLFGALNGRAEQL